MNMGFIKHRAKISIIVPVFNVEEFLNKCIDSIVSQSYSNIEIILVNDGSTDGSGEICDQWAKKDNRIRIIHKKNGGLSDARNAGIEEASGDFISFIDSDDFISPTYIQYLYDLLIDNDADLSVCQLFEVDEYGKELNKRSESLKKEHLVQGNEKCLQEFLINSDIGTVAWRKLYRTCMFKPYFRYPKGKYHEDVWTTYKYIAKCNRIAIGYQQLYAYRIRRGSIMNSVFTPSHLDGVRGSIVRFNDIKEQYPTLTKEAALNIIYSANQCMVRLGKIKCLDAEYIDYLHEVYRNYISYYLRGNSTLKPKFFAITARIMPRILIRIIHRLS